MKTSRTNLVIGLTVAVLALILLFQSPPADEDRVNPEDMYTDAWITSPDPLPVGASTGETDAVGRLVSAKIPVTTTTLDSSKPSPDTWRGFSNVTAIDRGYGVRLVLLDGDGVPILYPVTWSPRRFYGDLQYLMGSSQVQIQGEVFNYLGWDGETYRVLRLTGVSLYSVAYDPVPLSRFQVKLTMDARYYHLNDTAKLTVANLSQDWLVTGRSVELFREENGSIVEVQAYPDDYLKTDEQISFFPGTSWSHSLPLYHLEPGEYTVVKEVHHRDGPKVKVEANFAIVERLISRANETHRYALRALNCTLPEVPERLAIPRVVHVPITTDEAVEIAINVFGFEEPIEVDENRFTVVRSGDSELEFLTRYDIFYHGSYGTFNIRNETRVVDLVKDLVSKLERYWVHPTPLNYSISIIRPSLWTDGTVQAVSVSYQLSLNGVALWGPGADFGVGVSNYEVSGCEIRRPVLVIDGHENIQTNPAEAIRKMLRGQSDTSILGFDILRQRPTGVEVTINKVSLIYYTGLPHQGSEEWLVPAYMIEGVYHVDPVEYEEETMDFHEYILATGFPYERTISEGSDLAGLTVRVETDKMLYELGETVQAEVKLVNNGGIPIHVNISQPISLNGFGVGETTATYHPVQLGYMDLGNNSSRSMGVYAFEPKVGGLYVLEFAGSYSSLFVSDGAHREGFNMSARKLTFRTGEAVAFNVECVEPVNGSYVVVWNSHGEHVWTSDPFDEWFKIDDSWVLPFYQQTANGVPMVLSGGDLFGVWGYTWHTATGEKITDGYFNVAWMLLR